jgi:hypothetical protein
MEKDFTIEANEDIVVGLIDQVENGEINPLVAYAKIKRMLDLYTSAKSQVEPLAMEEAEKYPDNTFGEGGFIFERRAGGASYNYKHIPEWMEAENAKKQIEAKYKQAFLARQKGLLVASEDAEEMILPEIMYRKSSLIVKK